MKDDHIAYLPYSCLLGKNRLPARKQCIVVGRNTPKRSRLHLHIYIIHTVYIKIRSAALLARFRIARCGSNKSVFYSLAESYDLVEE